MSGFVRKKPPQRWAALRRLCKCGSQPFAALRVGLVALHQGRLAASVSHPNVVYIYGSEEIGGNPVIAMELVSSGTLKDRVKREGPLPPAKAVDAALEIISGL